MRWNDHSRRSVIASVLRSNFMGFFVEVRCIETGETFNFLDHSTITYYRFNDESIRVPQGPAWCHNCHRVQMAETYPQHIAARQAFISAARNDPNSDIAFILGYPSGLETHAAELETLMAHLKSRTAGPKCLTCFSEHIQVLPDEGIVLLPDGKHYTIANCGLGDSTYQIELELDVNGNEICKTKR